jgi:hypothetical protein
MNSSNIKRTNWQKPLQTNCKLFFVFFIGTK